MLDNQRDRLEYGQLLRPEYYGKVNFAVGLTYSLDLEAMLSVPICFGMLDDIDLTRYKNKAYLLEAIRRTGDRFAFFCNAGSMKVPAKNPLFSLLESNIFEIKVDPKNPRYNFHPKLWVIEYTEGEKTMIKVIVLSRNMTFDRSLDIAVEMHGEVTNKQNQKNKPLADLLEYVLPSASRSKRIKIKKLMNNLMHVESFELSREFEDYDFFPFGFGRYRHTASKLLSGARDLIVVSPFLSKTEVRLITKNVWQKTLITRTNSVNEDIYDAFDGEVYAVRDHIQDDSILDEGNDSDAPKREVHAKFYYIHKSERGVMTNYLYIGSLNLSHNAFENNIELLLRLKHKNKNSVYKKIKDELLPEKFNPFQILMESDALEEKEAEVNISLDEAVYSIKGATLKKQKDGNYTVVVECDETMFNYEVEISPYQFQKFTKLQRVTEIRDIPLSKLSKLFELRREGKSVLTKIDIKDFPYEERDNEIYNEIISDKEKFLSYVTGFFDDSFLYDSVISDSPKGSRESVSSSDSVNYHSLYESMLEAGARSPERLKGLEDIVRRLKDDRVPNELKIIVEKFRKTAGRKKYAAKRFSEKNC